MTTEETAVYSMPPFVCFTCGVEYGSEGHACKGLARDGVPVVLLPAMPPDTVALVALGDLQRPDAEQAAEIALYRCPHCGVEHEYEIQHGPKVALLSRWMHKPCLDAGYSATMVPVQVRDATGWRPVRPGEWTKRDGWEGG